jgi:chorismate synthase
MVAIVDGFPAGLSLDLTQIQQALDERRPGLGRSVSQRQEFDQVQVLSGIFRGQTTGASIALLIENQDAKPSHYEALAEVFRPGHADYTYQKKYGHRDYRGGGRASARETAMWVAAGQMAEQLLCQYLPYCVAGAVTQVGDIQMPIPAAGLQTDRQVLFLAQPERLDEVEALVAALRREGDSVGGRICVRAEGIPAGLGEPVFAKLDGYLAMAMMSIPAVKGVEIGDGFAVCGQKGSGHRDEMTAAGFLSNHAGGILGGISTGQPIEVALAIKPASSIRVPGRTLTHEGDETLVVTQGRHDPCVALRAVPVAKAMMSWVLADAYLCQLKNQKNRSKESGYVEKI